MSTKQPQYGRGFDDAMADYENSFLDSESLEELQALESYQGNEQDCNFTNDEGARRARAQTTEEWLREYDTGEIVIPAAWSETADPNVTSTELSEPRPEQLPKRYYDSTETTAHLNRNSIANFTVDQIGLSEHYTYVGHRTAAKYGPKTWNSVVLVFRCNQTGREIDCFYRADLTIRRGPKKGTIRKTGKGGAFNTAENSDFRKFWMHVVGRPPLRWAAVHKEIRTAFKGKRFIADVTQERNQQGATYWKGRNIRLL